MGCNTPFTLPSQPSEGLKVSKIFLPCLLYTRKKRKFFKPTRFTMSLSFTPSPLGVNTLATMMSFFANILTDNVSVVIQPDATFMAIVYCTSPDIVTNGFAILAADKPVPGTHV